METFPDEYTDLETIELKFLWDPREEKYAIISQGPGMLRYYLGHTSQKNISGQAIFKPIYHKTLCWVGTLHEKALTKDNIPNNHFLRHAVPGLIFDEIHRISKKNDAFRIGFLEGIGNINLRGLTEKAPNIMLRYWDENHYLLYCRTAESKYMEFTTLWVYGTIEISPLPTTIIWQWSNDETAEYKTAFEKKWKPKGSYSPTNVIYTAIPVELHQQVNQELAAKESGTVNIWFSTTEEINK